MLLAKSLGGVPVFSLLIVNLLELKNLANFMEGSDPSLPAGHFSLPLYIRPERKVPVVTIMLLQKISPFKEVTID